MNITSQFNTSQHRRAFVMPSSCLRFLRRANVTPKVEARGIQNGMKKSPSSPDEPLFFSYGENRIFGTKKLHTADGRMEVFSTRKKQITRQF